MTNQPEELSEGVKRARDFMLRRDKPGIAKRKPPLVTGERTKEGIFLGTWRPKDREGNSLGKIFNVFAAPQDLPNTNILKKIFNVFAAPKRLPDTMEYVDAVKHIAKLKGWNGFDGTNYATDKELYKSLKDGSYNGGWIIPTRDILRGYDIDGKYTTPDNLFARQNKGAFKGTFKTAESGGFNPGWYWSSTENRDYPSAGWIVQFSGGGGCWNIKDGYPLSCRPVRLVEASAPAPASR